MRDELIKLIKDSLNKHIGKSCLLAENIVDDLLANGVIVPPDELYSIVDKGTIYASISKAISDWLPLYVIKNPEKYGYYKSREEAEEALKGGAE